MRSLAKATLAAVLAVGLVSALGQPAHGDIGTPVECTGPGSSNPHCEVVAENEPHYADAGGGNVVCRQGGEEVPCVNEDGWLGSDGCRYRRLDNAPPPSHLTQPGAMYLPTCPGDPPNAQRAAVWLPDSDAPGLSQLAEIAVSRLAPPAPQIALSPPAPAPVLVMLPVWLWVEEQTWQPRTATASVPGVSVTAIATPVRVEWSTGDGTTRTCDGPGEPWRVGIDPRAESPVCGHTYPRPSSTEPGGTYQLRASVTWQVSWSGGGGSGTVDPLTTTASVPVRVVESLARNVGSQP